MEIHSAPQTPKETPKEIHSTGGSFREILEHAEKGFGGWKFSGTGNSYLALAVFDRRREGKAGHLLEAH